MHLLEVGLLLWILTQFDDTCPLVLLLSWHADSLWVVFFQFFFFFIHCAFGLAAVLSTVCLKLLDQKLFVGTSATNYLNLLSDYDWCAGGFSTCLSASSQIKLQNLKIIILGSAKRQRLFANYIRFKHFASAHKFSINVRVCMHLKMCVCALVTLPFSLKKKASL